ncbi:MAG TPA: hypothetical protein VFQ34_15275 [Nitrospiraceae bacterium]|nr:hypothetical protein [Nitrospiraceae bacterium]
MEQTVEKNLISKVPHGVDQAQEMMPLKDLVEEDPIEEPSEREAKQIACPDKARGDSLAFLRLIYLSYHCLCRFPCAQPSPACADPALRNNFRNPMTCRT